ncbi:two-component hybrid sensor and regulator [Sorangium cellulosum]|uniref:histidine kinase n=1 Tax=Sorangium cellulosum TaxID=56 RepID=A0A2L0EQP6_SORCE|nr:response regulator [Sorangium cellulosum]AUX41619.1 two-component hybrid sensor and regulator [Sorangium cellulosum]
MTQPLSMDFLSAGVARDASAPPRRSGFMGDSGGRCAGEAGNGPPSSDRAGRAVVWILDDSPLEAEMAARALAAAYEIEVFSDAAAMLERMTGGDPPDVLVLDQMMPGMSGSDVCSVLRSNPPTVGLPILILTVAGQEQDLVEGLTAGADDYVVKPCPAAALSARVGALVRSKRLRERAERAEQAAAVERDLLRALIEQSGVGIMATDERGVLRICNREAQRQHGVLGRSNGPEGPGGRRLLAAECCPPPLDDSPLERALRGERIENARWRVTRSDGSIRALAGTASPLRHADGSSAGAVLITRDQTDAIEAERALRESEERYRVIISALEEGITLQDAAGVIRTANASAERILGMSLDELVGSTTYGPFLRMLREDGSPFPHEMLPANLALRTGEPQSGVTLGVERRDGTIFWLSVNARPLHTADGAIAGVVTSFFDVTARRRAEEERQSLLSAAQAARREAEAASQLKDEFLATMSHELRTPLTAVLGWIRMLRTGKLSEDRREKALETVERNAQAQAQLVDDLLDISRIMAGKLRLDVQPIELAAVMEAALEVVRPAADAKGVRLEPLLDPGVGAVSGDAGRLQQVVWNLLSNAVKFTSRGGVVRVRLERVDASAEVVVSDTGQGIDPAFLPYVFEQFRQADSGTTRKHGGLGLGLTIVKSLVEMHGGTAHATSEGRGRGATFTVRLPLTAPSQRLGQRRRQSGLELPSGIEPRPELDRLNILVVDDEEDTRELVAAMLEQCGAHVTAVASTAEALAALRALQPDVLVSDIAIPGEDGYELIRKVRALPARGGGRTPAVALTAYARTEDRMRALRAGFNTHVPKPIDPAELLAVIANLARTTGGP